MQESAPDLMRLFLYIFQNFWIGKLLLSQKKLKTAEGHEIKIADIKSAVLSKKDLKCIDVSTTYAADALFYKTDWSIRKGQCVPQLYSSVIPINKEKLKNLQDLCRNLTIKKQYHAEYFSLTSNVNVPDELPETDAEDNSS